MKGLIFLFGACIGSFFDVLKSSRLYGSSIFRKRSHCDSCGHTLLFRDMIPVLSFLRLRGRCRFCHAKISGVSFWIEVLSGFFFLCIYSYPWPTAIVLSMNFLLLFLMAESDRWTHSIENRELYSLFLINICYGLYCLFSHHKFPVGSILFCFFILSLCYITKEQYFGLGDAQLLLAMSFLFSTFGFFRYFYFAILPAGAVALFFYLKGFRKKELPMVPFLFFAFFLQFLFPSGVLL